MEKMDGEERQMSPLSLRDPGTLEAEQRGRE